MRLRRSCTVSQPTAGAGCYSTAGARKCRRSQALVRAHPRDRGVRATHAAASSQTPLPGAGFPHTSHRHPHTRAYRWCSASAPAHRNVASWATPDAPNINNRQLVGPTPPPEVFDEGPANYPETERDIDMDWDTSDGSPDGSSTIHSDPAHHPIEAGEVPELPFELGEDFMEEIRKYLIEEEGMDAKDQRALDAEVFKMADNLCEMSMAEEDAALDAEILNEMVTNMRPYAESQVRYEKQQKAGAQGAAAAGGVAGVDMGDEEVLPEGWENDESDVGDEVFDALEDPADLNGWGTTMGMELPEGVSREAIATFLDWDAECHATREGPKGSMGWQEGRGALHPSLAADQQGIKGWQLSTQVHPKLAELAGNIEALWRQMFPLDFSQTDVDPRWKLVDSMDPNQTWGIDYGTEDPEPGDPRWPRLALENRFYQTEKFRCLHLEIGIRQDGFQVLHCVMWPRREYDLPIFGADVVAIGADVTFAIADTTPVNDARQLPDTYVDAVRLLRAQFADGMRRAELPDWGEKLFSEEVMSVRPDLPVEADLVGMHVTALCKAHILYSKFAENIKIDAGDASRLAEVDRNHRRYCNLQLENEKTAAVLKRSFRYLGDASDLFVARYMTEVLFNHDFHYDVDPQTKQELKDNRKDLGVSMGISKDKRDQIQDKVLDGLRAGFMEAEEAGLDGLGLSDDEEDESKGEPDSGAGSNKESS